jgi:crossover junction endodeoxyribonuclease RuvC
MAGRNDLSVFEYSPTQVKSAIGGGGRARKDQVQHMLRLLLRLPADYSFVSHDHSDALAIAITHVHAKQNLSTQFKHGRLSKSDRISSRKDSLSQPE